LCVRFLVAVFIFRFRCVGDLETPRRNPPPVSLPPFVHLFFSSESSVSFFSPHRLVTQPLDFEFYLRAPRQTTCFSGFFDPLWYYYSFESGFPPRFLPSCPHASCLLVPPPPRMIGNFPPPPCFFCLTVFPFLFSSFGPQPPRKKRHVPTYLPAVLVLICRFTPPFFAFCLMAYVSRLDPFSSFFNPFVP